MKDIYILDNDETIFNDLTSEFKKHPRYFIDK